MQKQRLSPFFLRSEFIRRIIPSVDWTLSLADGLRIVANCKRHLGLFRPGARQREAGIAARLASYVPPHATIYDIGANIGLYTLMFAHGRPGKVLSFEPTSLALSYLRRNVELNGMANVEIHPVVLSSYTGSIRFTLDYVTTATSHVSAMDEPGDELPCADLDSYVETKGLSPPGLIKMDVEGHEMPILQGMRRTLERHRPIVYIEGGTRSESGDIRAIGQLQAMGYTTWNLERSAQVDASTGDYYFVALPQK